MTNKNVYNNLLQLRNEAANKLYSCEVLCTTADISLPTSFPLSYNLHTYVEKHFPELVSLSRIYEGGSHVMILKAPLEDVKSALELVAEYYSEFDKESSLKIKELLLKTAKELELGKTLRMYKFIDDTVRLW